MERVAGAQSQRMLIDELRRGAEMRARDRQHREGLRRKPVEGRQRCRALLQREQPRSQFDRKSGGRLGDGPFADSEFGWVLLHQPLLCPARRGFVANSCNDQGRADVEHQ